MSSSDIVRDSFGKLLEVEHLLQRQRLPEARLLAASIRTRHMRDRALLLCTLSRPVDGQKST